MYVYVYVYVRASDPVREMAVLLAKDDQVLFTKLLLTRSYKTKLGCHGCVDVGVAGCWEAIMHVSALPRYRRIRLQDWTLGS